jgi:hypothetical protein
MADDFRSRVLHLASGLPVGDPTRRRVLEALAKDAYDPGVMVQVNMLPPGIQKALKALRFGGRDIRVRAEARPQMTDFGGDGMQAFFEVVDILTGRVIEQFEGSWGGPNPFQSKPLDQPDRYYDLKSGFAALHGVLGGRKHVTISYHPSDRDTFVPESEVISITPEEKKALTVISYKSGYRRDEWRRSGLPGEYSVDNPLIRGLVEKGLVETNRAGAIMLTTKGRNLR